MSASGDVSDPLQPQDVLSNFVFERLLNQDQAGRRVSLLGKISDQPAILLAERAAFSANPTDLSSLTRSLTSVQNLGANDIYYWFLANTATSPSAPPNDHDHKQTQTDAPHDLKINIICPCTPTHIAKYATQGLRLVTETPAVYRAHVRPYMQRSRDAGRLSWIFNIIEGRQEQEQVIYREAGAPHPAQNEGFLLLPDLNWDRRTLTSLHLLAIVERRDIWSVRDLRAAHTPWLRSMRRRLTRAATGLYAGVDADQLKFYVHYQPTYYHFHIHVTHVMLEPGATQAVGKALSLENVIGQLQVWEGEGVDKGMADVDISYVVGEASDLWLQVFKPLKEGEEGGEGAEGAMG